MRRILLFCLAMLIAGDSYAAGNLYEKFKDYDVIKVCLKDVTDESGNASVKLEAFKAAFGDALDERVGMAFKQVSSLQEADVAVSCKINRYEFDEDPIPLRPAPWFINAVAVVADTVEPKSAAKIVVTYEITDPSRGKKLFDYKKMTTEVRKPKAEMKGDEAYRYAAKENIDTFVYRAFYKQKNK